MRIIYSAPNRIGANIQLSRFLKNLDSNHEIKIAAYNKSSYSIKHIDWLLDSIPLVDLEYKDELNSIRYNQYHIENLIKDVAEFNPDLIISDNEYLFGHIAHEVDVPLWYCSPLNLLNGIKWKNERLIYSYYFYRYKKYKFPKADKYLIYSPFCDIKKQPQIKETYEWVRPYYEDPIQYNIEEFERKEKFKDIIKYIKFKNDYSFTDGNTDSISDSLYNNKKIIISPNINNVEALINGVLVSEYNIGYNLGQIELMETLAVEEIENAYNKTYAEVELNNKQHLQLHEMIDEF
jgi:hypothetical protein